MQLLFTFFIPIVSFFISRETYLHDIHVSKCEIQFNEDSSTFEIATQIYIDDLQKSLLGQGFPELHLCSDRELKNADDYLFNYLSQKIRLTVDGKSLTPKYIGKEPSDDFIAVWCYLEFSSPKSFKELKVKDEVLMDLYDDQRNIVNIKVKDQKGYLLLYSKHNEETVKY